MKWTDSLENTTYQSSSRKKIHSLNSSIYPLYFFIYYKFFNKENSRPEWMVLLVNSTKNVRKKRILIPYKLFRKLKMRGWFPVRFLRPALPWYQNQTKTSQENYRAVITPEHRCEILNRSLANGIQTTY